MNINPTTHVHSEAHNITNCMHEHHTPKTGGMSFQSEMQQMIREQPQTLEDALNELSAINQQIYDKHKILGTGNTLGNIISDVAGEGEETVIMLMPENMADAKSNDNNIPVSPDMLNALVMPRNTSIHSQEQNGLEKRMGISDLSEFDTKSKDQFQKRKKKFIQYNSKGIKKRIRKWLQSLPEKLSGHDKDRAIKKKEMKPLTQEYILDSYDKNGQYFQVEKQGIVKDFLNKKA